MVWSYIANIVQMLGTILVVASLRRWALVHKKQKKLVTTTRATLAQESEQAAAQATTNQQAEPEVQPHEECPINQELRQEGQVEPMTQASTTILSQMIGEVICTNSLQINIFYIPICVNHFFLQGSEPTSLSQPQGPLPDNAFITSNQHVQRPIALTTCTKAGKAASSRRGVVIHCKYCLDAGHNSTGCKYKKMGFTSEEAKELVATTRATLAQEAEQAAAQATTNQQTEQAAINQESTKRKAARTSSNDANEATAKNSKPRKGAAANKS